MKELTFFKGYQQDEQKRAAFNHLAVKTFDLSFENGTNPAIGEINTSPTPCLMGSKPLQMFQ